MKRSNLDIAAAKILKNKHFLNRDLVIMFVCILIAGIFWLFTVLSKPCQSTIKIGLAYDNLDSKQVFKTPPATNVSVLVTASGWELIASFLYLNTYTITIDMLKYESVATLSTSMLQDLIEKELPHDAHIKSIQPNVLHFEKEERVSKKVPIILNHDLQFANQYDLNGSIKITPDSIEISGGKSVLDTIHFWLTSKLTLKGISQSVSERVSLAATHYFNMSLSEKTVKVDIPVEQFTEGLIEVDIALLNIPKNIAIIIIPKKIKVTYQVALSKFDNVSKELFSASVDFSKIDVRSNNNIDIDLTQYPLFIKHINYFPKRVEYIIYE